MVNWYDFAKEPEEEVKMTGLNELIGKDVEVTWNDESNGLYRILAIDKAFIKLQWIQKSKENKSSQDSFWANLNYIEIIKEVSNG